MKVLCVGMMVCDILISPVPCEIMKKDSIKINQPVLASGGDALNVAISLSKLGLKVSIARRVGNDTNGRFLLSECEKNGVDYTNVINDPTCSTATSFALIDTEGERHF
jgi:sugar/nucleoside kinase (ribokinase family)